MNTATLPAPSLFSTFVDSLRAGTRMAAISALSPFERWVMHWLFTRALRRGWTQERLTQVMTELSQATRKTFLEDNDPTVDAFLRESLESAIADTSVCGTFNVAPK